LLIFLDDLARIREEILLIVAGMSELLPLLFLLMLIFLVLEVNFSETFLSKLKIVNSNYFHFPFHFYFIFDLFSFILFLEPELGLK